MNVLGLDIGGANLKAAHTSGAAASAAFALWRHPEQLADELRRLTAAMPPADRVALTMTGELCDCFDSRRHGVSHILDAAAEAFGDRIDVWTTAGVFVDPIAARTDWLRTASANWLALATFAGRFAPPGPALLVDIGTTTIDLVPLLDGRPVPRSLTDRDRLERRELIYRGWRRTPLCAAWPEGAAEVFATMHDVCLLLRLVPEDAADRDTADGRPATAADALRRFARHWCAEPADETVVRWHDRARRVVERLAVTVEDALGRLERRPTAAIISGSGAFLAPQLLESLGVPLVWLEEKIGPEASDAACAVAVAALRAG